jgi:para-nitrobenzyl esterase
MLTTILVTTGLAQQRVKVSSGTLEGTCDRDAGVTRFAGIPFAMPPTGELRWRPPQPVKPWKGVRKADHFGPRAMQMPVFGDMAFRSDGMSEDCLYLNVWTPARSARAKLPVLVYFYGGGFIAGDGSEGRYDGQSMATKGIVAVTVNYRLGVFGFFAHPELTKESLHHASGNCGLLDQNAALVWVQKNIAAFGGDPRRVTIAGESAGSISVSAQMASPLSQGLMSQAIGESGAILGALSAVPLAEAEASGVKLASSLGIGSAPSLSELRAMPAQELIKKAAKAGFMWFSPTVDGYLFPTSPEQIYTGGKQAHVPLLAGVNSEESGYAGILGQDQPTVENYRKALERLYPDKGDVVFRAYPASSESEVMDAAQALAGDRFISHSTWRWLDQVTRTASAQTYYYVYSHPRPAMRPEMGNAVAGLAGGVVRDANAPKQPRPRGAVHSAEIEYCMGNLDQNRVYAWAPEDYKVSKVMQEYFANFIKTGSPNGQGLADWPRFAANRHLVIDVTCHAETNDKLAARYTMLDQIGEKQEARSKR